MNKLLKMDTMDGNAMFERLLLTALCWATVCLTATVPGRFTLCGASLEMREW